MPFQPAEHVAYNKVLQNSFSPEFQKDPSAQLPPVSSLLYNLHETLHKMQAPLSCSLHSTWYIFLHALPNSESPLCPSLYLYSPELQLTINAPPVPYQIIHFFLLLSCE